MSATVKKVPHADFGEWWKAQENEKVAFGRTSLEALTNWLKQYGVHNLTTNTKRNDTEQVTSNHGAKSAYYP